MEKKKEADEGGGKPEAGASAQGRRKQLQ
jgi:hypothetical protein